MFDAQMTWRRLWPLCKALTWLHYLYGPRRIVCLTEETTEWLYLLGEERASSASRATPCGPRRAREEKPRVSAFLSAKIDKILELKPDCVFGFSDLQADIAAELVKRGVQVTIFNQRSVEEIFSMLYQVAAMVGRADEGLAPARRHARAACTRSRRRAAPCRAGRACSSRSGTSRTSARSAGCRS
jgi:ABC-type hemin transport system substrate-binding protein